MRNELQRAFSENNIELISDFIIDRTSFISQTQRTIENACKKPRKSLDAVDPIICRFLSIEASNSQRILQQNVLFHLLNQSKFCISTPREDKRNHFKFSSMSLVPAIRMLCEDASEQKNTCLRRKAMFSVAFKLLCSLILQLFQIKLESCATIPEQDTCFEEKLTDFECGLSKMDDTEYFDVSTEGTLKYRHFASFFSHFDDTFSIEMYRLLRKVNSKLLLKSQKPIFLSYDDYAKILSSDKTSLDFVKGVFSDLNLESAATDDNISVKKSLESDHEVTSGSQENNNRRTWGTILSLALVDKLSSRFKQRFVVSKAIGRIDGVTTCEHCATNLKLFPEQNILNANKVSEIYESLLAQASDKQKKDFHKFCSEMSTKDDTENALYVIDALNVGYYAKSRWGREMELSVGDRIPPQYTQIDALVSHLLCQGISPNAIQIVLPEKHHKASATNSLHKSMIAKWKSHGMFVECPDTLTDDIFWLVRAMNHWTKHLNENNVRTFIITNDQMRDHQVKIGSGASKSALPLFKQWKSAVQVFFDVHVSDDERKETETNESEKFKVSLFYPPKLIYAIQSGERHWHVPFDGNKDAPSIRANDRQSNEAHEHSDLQWLCIDFAP